MRVGGVGAVCSTSAVTFCKFCFGVLCISSMVCCAGQAVFILAYFVFLYSQKCVVLTVLCMCVVHSVCVWHTECAVQAVSATPAVTPRSPTPPLASGKSFLFPTLGKQIVQSLHEHVENNLYPFPVPLREGFRNEDIWPCMADKFLTQILRPTKILKTDA